ncbi:MAG TPA: non-ribosomal peptide synthetase, partial [Calditrichae bacterium]|nr:non-ribosomal peptide synthetase [Calditrichia bacterium]
LTPNGKIDRKRLPAPESVKKERPEFVQPGSGIERQVADLWKEILQVDTVGLNDNFFDLGGHSLNVIQLQTRVKEVFDREIAVVDLFKYPTVSAFARFLSEGHEEKQVTAQARERVAKQRSALNIQRARMRKRRQS